MLYNSARLALFLAAAIAIVTVLFVALFGKGSGSDLVSIFIITSMVGFLVIYFSVDRLIFRPLKNIGRVMDKLTRNEPMEEQKPGSITPLTEVSEQIEAFAAEKQHEIDRLRKQEAFRKDFIADVSHELKTPIFAAQGFVHTLLDGAVKDKAVRGKFLKKAAKSLDGLDILVQDLLTLSQIETGQIKMRFENIDLYALTEEVFEQFRGKTNKKEMILRIEGPVRKVMVHADWQRISQVMTNLISNAIKHSEEGGEVVVSFAVKKKSVHTRVRDFGAGIPPEHINRIFERFYRVDKSRSREKGGTGLGLAIVKHILEGHHSKPQVVSEPGRGSTFSFRLPKGITEIAEDTESLDSENN